jgi:hypothetical protein
MDGAVLEKEPAAPAKRASRPATRKRR